MKSIHQDFLSYYAKAVSDEHACLLLMVCSIFITLLCVKL